MKLEKIILGALVAGGIVYGINTYLEQIRDDCEIKGTYKIIHPVCQE